MIAPLASALIELALKSTILLALVFPLAAALRRWSAAERHGLWVFSLIGLLVLPAATLFSPGIEVRLPAAVTPVEPERAHTSVDARDGTPASANGSAQTPPAVAAEHTPTQPGGAEADPSPSAGHADIVPLTSLLATRLAPRPTLAFVGAAAYAAIALLLLAYLTVAAMRVSWSLRGLSLVENGRTLALLEQIRLDAGVRRAVQLRISDTDTTPWVWGWRHPVIVVPEAFFQWPDAAQRNALLHEVSHVARYDYLTSLLGYLCCALYWFQPLVWLAAKRMSRDAERACDDRVLVAGGRRSVYASQLLELASSMHREGNRIAACAMAKPSTVSQRITSILDVNRRRATMGRARALGTLILTGALVLALGAVKSHGDEPAGEPGGISETELVALIASGPKDSEQLELLVRTHLARGLEDEAVGVLRDYVWPYGYGAASRAPPDEPTEARCGFCRSVLASEATPDPDEALPAMLAAFDDVENRAREAGDGNPLIRLAVVVLETDPQSVPGGRGLWFLLEGFRVGNLTDDWKMEAVAFLYRVGAYEQAKALVEQMYDDASSSLYQSGTLSQWTRHLDARLRLMQYTGTRVLAANDVVDGEFVPVHQVAPAYPAEAAAQGLEGHVIVEFTVNEHGRAQDVTVVESSDAAFEEAAGRAASRLLYVPRIVGGAAIAVPGVRYLFRFVLDD